ncbi:MAG: BamA/TamA family outer membrane protein [Polyangia bacterium]|jgi:outer membrane protein assembly factor BamA
MNSHRSIWAALIVVSVAAWPVPAAARLVVDHIAVRGPAAVTTRVLATRMHLYPGDTVDFAVLKAAEQRLIESDLFSSVRVFVDLPTPEAVRRMYLDGSTYPVEVVVEAVGKQPWIVFPTASFGSGDWAGGVAYANQNLLGRDVQLVGAGQIGQSLSYIFAGYRDPLVVGAPLTYSLSALYRQEQIRFFVNHRMVMQVPTTVAGGDGQIGWVLSPHTRAFLGWSARYQAVSPVEGLAPGATSLPYNSRAGRIFLLQFQFQYDSTHAEEGLRQGILVFIKNEVSDRYWESDFDYSKFESRVELYGRYKWNYPSLVLKAVFNYPSSDHGVPVTEMLRIGGPSLRGYLTNEFHGDTLVLAQAEDEAVLLRLRLPWTQVRFNVAAALFVDAATLLDRFPGGTTVPVPDSPPPPVRSNLDDIHASFGGGVRVILPGVVIPALKVDVGYGIDVRDVAVTVSIAGGGIL